MVGRRGEVRGVEGRGCGRSLWGTAVGAAMRAGPRIRVNIGGATEVESIQESAILLAP